MPLMFMTRVQNTEEVEQRMSLYYTHPFKKTGSFQLQFSRVGGERICTVSDLRYTVPSRFRGLLDRLHLWGNASDIFGGSLNAPGDVRRRVTLFVDGRRY
jgi:hypothetical protein